MTQLVVVLLVIAALAIAIVQAEFIPIQKLVGADRAGPSRFGYAVAISGDGNTAMIGGPWDSSQAGAIWTYDRLANGSWKQQGDKLMTSSNGTGYFGWSIALSADGRTALIGSPAEGASNGTVRFYTRLANKAWVQQGERFQGKGRQWNALIGQAVAMNPKATMAFIGGSNQDSFKGAVWVVKKHGKRHWKQLGLKLEPSDSTGAQVYFGSALAVSNDARTLLVGGPCDKSFRGAAWIFKRIENGTYIQTQPKLVPTDVASFAQFGTSVSLSSDGSTALIGAPDDATGLGGMWIFTKSAEGTFVQQTLKLVPSNTIGSPVNVGNAVALSADGYMAMVGGYSDDSFVGGVWVFCRYANDSWIQSGKKISSADYVLRPEQGFSLAISSDASTLLAGGPNENDDNGAAWIFETTSPICPDQPTKPQCGKRCHKACKNAKQCYQKCLKSCQRSSG